MRRHLAVAVAALLSLLGVTEAAASTQNFFNYCTTGQVRTCASVQVETVDLGGATRVILRVRNLEGTNPHDNTMGSRITAVGITHPALANVQAANPFVTTEGGDVGAFGNPETRWSILDPNVIGGTVTFGVETPQGVHGGILGCANAGPMGGAQAAWFRTCPGAGFGGWVVFSFTTTTEFVATDANFAFGVQSIQSPQLPGGSLQCVPGNPEHPCAPTQVVPEPMTMALLGTGLAGIGMAARRRRRKDGDLTGDVHTEDDR